ncbi:probable receptor-like protein kinase At5g24010 [Typha angustifolia]|uniref:probable receptor-like protein kinase At5g24010 n=1 Tax=Typha angustifolia TaxID=59011 RepID=UPI003C30D2B3
MEQPRPPATSTSTSTTLFFSLLLLLLLLLFFPLPSLSSFLPSDSFLLSCGSSSPSLLLSSNRRFLPDSSFHIPPHSTSLANPSPSPPSPLHRTARVFLSPSSYSFPLLSPSSPHFLRLHFLPFLSLSSALFNVSLATTPLLSLFSAFQDATFEFFLVPNSHVLHLSFLPADSSSFAFVNAIELFSLPDDLISDAFVSLVPSSAAPLTSHLLETLHRVNVGGPVVTLANDTLWRIWIPDTNFVISPSDGKAIAFPGILKYPDGGATRETAPESVYGTARVMNRGNFSKSSSPANKFNISWVFPVSSSVNGYLVRLHFCDIVSIALNELYFDVYINGHSAYQDLDLSAQASYSLASPYYIDFVVGQFNNSSGSIRVSVGPSERSLPWKINAILNGVEIMKIRGVFSSTNINRRKKDVGIVVGLIMGSLFLIFGLVGLVLTWCRWKRWRNTRTQLQQAVTWSSLPALTGNSYSRTTELTIVSQVSNQNLLLRISFSEILLATNNFNESAQIGSGGFGKVYRGMLRDGTKVAVKRSVRGSQQGHGEFRTEIEVLSKIRHRHLVSLIGFCDEHSEMILVYEFMDKGPLRDHLYGLNCPPLSWKQRLEICIGAARGLHYLHTGSAEGIIHRDVKSSNILLDENYTAKVADFGLSKLGCQNSQSNVSTGVKGSFGYLDPEYFKTQQLTDKSDVYSFGVVLLEVMCARPVIDQSLPWEQVNLAEWAMQWQKKGLIERIIDPSLKGNIRRSLLRKFGETVEKCLAQYGIDRPTMGDVLWKLEYILQLQEKAVHQESYGSSSSSVPLVVSSSVINGSNGSTSESNVGTSEVKAS